MLIVILIVLLVLVFGGYQAGSTYGHSALGLVLLVLLILLLTGNMHL